MSCSSEIHENVVDSAYRFDGSKPPNSGPESKSDKTAVRIDGPPVDLVISDCSFGGGGDLNAVTGDDGTLILTARHCQIGYLRLSVRPA